MIFETLLFILLSPGLLLTLPAVSKRGYMSFKTSCMAVFIHAAVFAVLLYFKSYIPILGSLEGFQDKVPDTPPAPPAPTNPMPPMNPPLPTMPPSSTPPAMGSTMGRVPSNNTAKMIANSTASAAAQAYEMALQSSGGMDSPMLGPAKKVVEAARAEAAKYN
jgi:hypothetical protein